MSGNKEQSEWNNDLSEASFNRQTNKKWTDMKVFTKCIILLLPSDVKSSTVRPETNLNPLFVCHNQITVKHIVEVLSPVYNLFQHVILSVTHMSTYCNTFPTFDSFGS